MLKERQLDPLCSGISLAYKLFDAPSPNLALRQCFAAGGAPATDFSSRRQTLHAVWPSLLTELYPDGPDIAFALCDLGMGFPELGDVELSRSQPSASRTGRRSNVDLFVSGR